LAEDPQSLVWEIGFPSGAAERAWQRIQEADPAVHAELVHRLRYQPYEAYRLKGPLRTRTVAGKELEQFGLILADDRAISFCPDADMRVVWVIGIRWDRLGILV